MRSVCIFCILHGSVLAAKGDPGVPYTYTLIRIHVYYPDQFWLQKVIRAYLIRTFIRIYYPDQFWLQKVIRAYLMISFGSSGLAVHACTKCTWT